MVVLNRIYTRTGDKGETALSDGTRVTKDSLRVECYGTVDELNAVTGLARLHADDDVDAALARIQNDLFDVGADLARPGHDRDHEEKHPVLRASEGQIEWLEQQIDAMTARLEPLRSFILPGGTPLAAALHQCRTVCRRAERIAVALGREDGANPVALRYLNRLSDWYFVAARIANDGGRADILWVPGANR